MSNASNISPVLPDSELELLLRYVYEPFSVKAEAEKLLRDQDELNLVLDALKKEKEIHGFADMESHRLHLTRQGQQWAESLSELIDLYPSQRPKTWFQRPLWKAVAAAAVLLLLWWVIPTAEISRDELFAIHIEGNHLDPFEAESGVRGRVESEPEAKVIWELYKSGNFDQACTAISSLLREGVGGDVWLYRAGFACMKAGSEDAIRYFEQISAGELGGPALLMAGWVHWERGEDEKARAAWEEILKNEDTYPLSLTGAARELLQMMEN